jgi:cation transport ATPase
VPTTPHEPQTTEPDAESVRDADLTPWWLAVSVAGILTGTVLRVAGEPGAASVAWGLTTAVGILPLGWEAIQGLIHREAGVDLIALLAMAGALAVGEYLAGAVIALMLSSGQALEAYADRRAHKELSSLLERAPQDVSRYEDGELRRRPIEEVRPTDRLFVKTGEVVPVDGLLLSRDPSSAGPASRSAPARCAPEPASICERSPPPPRAPTQASSGWWPKPSGRRRPSSGWPIGTR